MPRSIARDMRYSAEVRWRHDDFEAGTLILPCPVPLPLQRERIGTGFLRPLAWDRRRQWLQGVFMSRG